MLDITIEVDARKVLGFLDDMAERQLPFALAKAVNETVLDVQRGERRQFRRVFEVRRADWVDKSVKIVKFAKKQDPVATIGIHAPGDESRSDILDKFEDQTAKLPKSGTIAIPVTGLLSKGSKGIIRNRNRPRDLVASGKAFIIRKKMGAVGEGLIVQRVNLGKFAKRSYEFRGKKQRRTSLVTLYYLARRARITPNLRFVEVANEVVDATFPRHMTTALDAAIRTAR